MQEMRDDWKKVIGMTQKVILDCRGQHRRLSEGNLCVGVADSQVADREHGWLCDEAEKAHPSQKFDFEGNGIKSLPKSESLGQELETSAFVCILKVENFLFFI